LISPTRMASCARAGALQTIPRAAIAGNAILL
jgi:hypothetical protein